MMKEPNRLDLIHLKSKLDFISDLLALKIKNQYNAKKIKLLKETSYVFSSYNTNGINKWMIKIIPDEEMEICKLE
jgi:hypothetical protein